MLCAPAPFPLTDMKFSSILASFASAALVLASSASAAPVSLTEGSSTYSYDIRAAGGVPDPNATLVNLMGTADASYYTTGNNLNGTLSYTVNIAADATNLNVSLFNLLAFGGPGSIVGTYSLDGAAPVTLFNDVTAAQTTGDGGSGTIVVIPHNDNLALNPATAHTVILDYAVNSAGSNNYQQQLMRHGGGGNGGPFTLTATFVPEPSSVGLLAIGSSLLIRRRRA